MIIEKILNNNVVTTIDRDTGLEKVVMGRGIAFKKKRGDTVDSSKVEKVFLIQNEKENRNFQKLFNKIPIEYIEVAEKIISFGQKQLDTQLDEHIYVALTDHLAFAIKRTLSGIHIKNHLMWEIKRLYRKEYEVGQWAIELIKNELGIELPEDEAGFIALHLLNASMGENMMNTIDATEMIQDILNIIKYYFKIDINTNDFFIDRLVTHLKYFAIRVLNKREMPEQEESLFDFIKKNYDEAYNCALKIKAYVEKKYNYSVSNEEIVYLSIHLQKIVSRFKN